MTAVVHAFRDMLLLDRKPPWIDLVKESLGRLPIFTDVSHYTLQECAHGEATSAAG